MIDSALADMIGKEVELKMKRYWHDRKDPPYIRKR